MLNRCCAQVGRLLVSLVAVALILPCANGESRIWTSSSGSHEIEAELVSADDESVKLVTADGRELTIALAKLSQADRDYVAEQASPEPDDRKVIKQIAVDFYAAIRDDPEKVRDFLTTKGQANFDSQRSYFKMGSADRGQPPRVTGIRFENDNQMATARFRVKMGGDLQKMEMLLTHEDEQWRVYGLVGLGKRSKITMNFDDAQSTNEPL